MGSIAKELMQDKTRPRRLEGDTLEYLKSVQDVLKEVETDPEMDSELMLWNILDELAKRAASAASDRHACDIVERLVDVFTARQLRVLIKNFAGYYTFLWTNRYSSHVLQKILARSGALIQEEEDGVMDDTGDADETDAETEDRKAPTLSSLIVEMITEVQPEIKKLCLDVSASHVLRSMLCVLAGRELLAEKRGKQAKHRALYSEINNKSTGEAMYTVPKVFKKSLKAICEEFITSDAEEIYNMLFDVHAGPVISMLLRVSKSKHSLKLTQHALSWDDTEKSGNIFYELCGDSVGSHFLEAVVATASKDMMTSVFDRCLKGRLTDYAQHQVANYVVQHAFRYIADTELLDVVLKEILPSIDALLGRSRCGVVWHLAGACSRLKHGQKQLLDALYSAETVKSSDQLASSLLAIEHVKHKGEARIAINVAAAQLLSTLMSFETPLALKVSTSIIAMKPESLVALAKDSTGGRHIIEPIWVDSRPEFEQQKRDLLGKLQGNFVALASSRFGVFTITKAFTQLAVDDKEKIVAELAGADLKLGGSSFGRLALKECMVQDFKTGKDKWLKNFEMKTKVEDLFRDIVPEKKAKKAKKAKAKKEKRKAEEPEAENDTAASLSFVMDALASSMNCEKKQKKAKKQKN